MSDVFGFERGEVLGLSVVFERGGFLNRVKSQTREEKKVEYNPLLLPHPPHHPELRGGKGRRGLEKAVKGLARDGTRWPSGARPSRPSQTVQVAGYEGTHINRDTTKRRPVR